MALPVLATNWCGRLRAAAASGLALPGGGAPWQRLHRRCAPASPRALPPASPSPQRPSVPAKPRAPATPRHPPALPHPKRSGVTAFLDESVGYPIPIDGLVPATGAWWFRGLSWAQPSVAHLRRLMRRVYERRAEAAARGAAARVRMVNRFSPPAVAALLAAELARIEAALPGLPEGE
jgi:hypothetical protein